jgi:O-antigen ligase
MVGFVTWAVVTLFWAVYPEIAMTSIQVYTLRLLLFLILIVNQIRTKETLDGLMNTLALNGWILILAGVGTLLRFGYIPGTRFQIFEMNENGFGVSILVAMSGVLWQVMRASGRQKARRRALSFIFIPTALILIALSGSRGSAISFFITLSAFWFWKPTRPWGKLGLLILVVALIAAPFLFLTLLERFAIERGDTLLGRREVIWWAAWRLIWDQPWSGVGIGNAPYVMLSYLRSLMSVSEYEWVAIHNPILTIWAETGIPGLLLYLSVLGSAVWLFVRQYWRHKQTGYLKPYYALVASVFLGYMASWIKGGGMESDFTYFLMLALLLIPSCLSTEKMEVR